MSDCIAYDDDGSVMTYYTINTISPLEFSSQAKQLSLFHLQNIENAEDINVNSMLPILLYDKITGLQTHIMCARPGYNNTIRRQQATMWSEFLNGSEWVSDKYYYLEDSPDPAVIKSKMCFVLGNTDDVLHYLGLEVK